MALAPEGMTMGSSEATIEISIDTLRIEGDATKLYEALAAAQAEFAPVPKVDEGQVGMSRKFKYAGYATLMKCVRPALTKHGIALIQPLHYRDEMAITTTILAGHGASIQTSFAFKADFSRTDKNGVTTDDCQEFGRCHTYYRRYQLQSILGIEGDDDADASDLPKAQFSEQVKEATPPKANGKAAPVQASVEPKPAVAKEEKTAISAKPSVASTASSEPAKAEPSAPDLKTLNNLIQEGMKQLSWKMINVREFYEANVDAAGFEKADNMTIDQKRALFDKMVALKNVTPF